MEEKSLGMEESFGAYLQNGRMMAGLLIADMAKKLYVSKETLRYLEAEEHARLPQPVFVRGFVRSYAQEMGLDAEYAMALYQKAYKAWDAMQKEALRRQMRRRRFFQLLRATLISVLIALGLSWTGVWLFHFFSSEEGPMEVSLPAASSTPVPQKSVHTGYRLEVRAVESTWVKIIIDEELPRSFSMNPGDVLEFDAEKAYNILIGSATGVRLRLNGKALPFSGASGQAVNLLLP